MLLLFCTKATVLNMSCAIIICYPNDTAVVYRFPVTSLTPELESLLIRDRGGFPYFCCETCYLRRPNTPNKNLQPREKEFDLEGMEGLEKTDNISQEFRNIDRLWIFYI